MWGRGQLCRSCIFTLKSHKAALKAFLGGHLCFALLLAGFGKSFNKYRGTKQAATGQWCTANVTHNKSKRSAENESSAHHLPNSYNTLGSFLHWCVKIIQKIQKAFHLATTKNKRSDSSYEGPLVCRVQAVTWGKHPMTGCKSSSCEQMDCHKPLFQRQWVSLVHGICGETANVYTANHQREVICSLEKKQQS